MQTKKPVVLLIRDGWGIGDGSKGDAVAAADTPHFHHLLANYPHCTIAAAGEPVGVRAGAQGSSEVGHLNMGAGRIVMQEVVRVDHMIRSGELFETPLMIQALENCKKNGSALHLMGLIQDQGVHAVQDHLYSFLEWAAKQGLTRVNVHFFSDGRDTPPQSALTYLEQLEQKMAQYGVGRVASVMGRYYAMDRGKNYDRTQQAFEALMHGKGLRAKSAREAIEQAYERANNHQGGDIPPETDEFILPTLIEDENGDCCGIIRPHDTVIHTNFRQDRAIQLTQAFVEPDFNEFDRGPVPDVLYAGLTRYYDEFTQAIIPPMNMANLLGKVLSDHGLWQLRIAEYQKYRHVTSFFNGKLVAPFPKEDRVLVDSISIPENQQPEMSVYEVTDVVLEAINGSIESLRKKARSTEKVSLQLEEHSVEGGDRLKQTYDFIAINFANCDMVGHTGVFDAVVKAVEAVDACVKQVCDAVLARDGIVMVTADHGNAEQMIDPETGGIQTSHTTNDVHLFWVSNDADSCNLVDHGKLSDIAVTILELMEIPVPAEMTATSLLKPCEQAV
ncbi:MAG: 2,3-bisphosphoglycerate-independent phosphoglycerate mutase [Desulfatibacillum sp.]|nr:2,3-bisphosphoglycerate-independent phosphoglycerate mutase [Desulfatibacillum sp.]